jgi:Low-density lipoprotein receptor domain class A
LSGKDGNYHGAARQSYGSGTLRSPSDGTFAKIHRDKQEQLTNRLNRESINDYGIMVKHEHQSPISSVYKPPSIINVRFPKQNSPMHVPSVHDNVLRPSIHRLDDFTYPSGIGTIRDKVFTHDDDLIFQEEAMLENNHQSSGSADAIDCDLKCGPYEFFCSKSCSCIHSDLHCDGQNDCGPDAEDEEECEITEEMVKKMRSECEGNTLSPHIMCPNTFICIKQDWLCGKCQFL